MNGPIEIVVVSGGPPPHHLAATKIPEQRLVLAVDRGYEHARNLGIEVDELIGDFDSLPPELLATAERSGVAIFRHRPDKEATDLELALDRVDSLARERPDLGDGAIVRVTIIGGLGSENEPDRFDHTVGQLGLLASPKFKEFHIDMWAGTARITPIHAGVTATFDGAAGEKISLIAIGGPALSVTTEGLRFPLYSEPLSPFSTRSISNEFLGGKATVSVGIGVVLAVAPEALTRER